MTPAEVIIIYNSSTRNDGRDAVTSMQMQETVSIKNKDRQHEKGCFDVVRVVL